jgi:carbon monoxide dehydrogenase subunit G
MSVKISGDLRLAVERGRLFRAIHDVDILRVTVPGCEALEQTAADTYTGTAKVGIAVIKGTYHGTVKLLEERGEEYIRVAVEAKSGHAEIRGEGGLTLTVDCANTQVRYEGDAQVRGPLAAVGQRLLPSASKSLTEQFFRNIEKKLQQENAS